METTNETRARNALLRLLDIAEQQTRSMLRLVDAMTGAFLSADVARYMIATRCEETAKLMEEKL